MEEKCLQCSHILFKKMMLDEIGSVTITGEKPKIESNGKDTVIICPQCLAKNVLIDIGDSKQVISHVKKN